jgi:hypothetical protein
MFYLLLIAISLLLFLAFMALTLMEARSGVRLLAVPRAKLDQQVERALFVINHVNWFDFISHMVQSFFARTAHDTAQSTLIGVRFLERQLTHVVRYMRDRRPNVLAPTPSRESPLTQTTSYLKKKLRLSKDEQE